MICAGSQINFTTLRGWSACGAFWKKVHGWQMGFLSKCFFLSFSTFPGKIYGNMLRRRKSQGSECQMSKVWRFLKGEAYQIFLKRYLVTHDHEFLKRLQSKDFYKKRLSSNQKEKENYFTFLVRNQAPRSPDFLDGFGFFLASFGVQRRLSLLCGAHSLSSEGT